MCVLCPLLGMQTASHNVRFCCKAKWPKNGGLPNEKVVLAIRQLGRLLLHLHCMFISCIAMQCMFTSFIYEEA
jgi:hypothetical protein